MKSNNDDKNFKDGLKATSLFGGVQVALIILNIIRSKIIAVLLGSVGMGIYGLYNTTINLLSSCTNLGLATSSVRDISIAHKEGDEIKVAKTISSFRTLVWLTGLFGLTICLVLSPLLSLWAFGDKSYTMGFVILSVSLLFNQISSGQTAVLQGLGKYRYMANAKLIGAVLALILTTPLYYVYGNKGIVWGILCMVVVSLIISWYYAHKVKLQPVNISLREKFKRGKDMASLGFFISLQGICATLAGYLVQIYISNNGNIKDVGMYTAGFAIINNYVGLVFTAMATDYYPRLSANVGNTCDFNSVINQQMQISLLLLSPLICFFSIFNEVAIRLLYSSEFLPISWMVTFAIIGVFLKAPGWCIGYCFVAKGDTKIYFITELIIVTINTVLNISFYSYWGLTGLGVSYMAGYIIYVFMDYEICKHKYNYLIENKIFRILVPQALISITCVMIVFFSSMYLRYTIGPILILFSCYLSYKELERRLSLKKKLMDKF